MKKSFVVCLLAGAALMFATQAQATTLTFDLGYVFSGAAPNSTSPYGTVEFRSGADCLGTACAGNTVQMVLKSSLENASEFFTEWDFNSQYAFTSIAPQAGGTGSWNAPDIYGYCSNCYKADGDGWYDFSVVFGTANSGLGRFNGTDTARFLITATGINTSWFNVVSAPGGGAGPFHTAAHIQGITPNCSGWVAEGAGSAPGTTPCGTTPDSGTTVALLGLALLGVGYIRRKIS